MSIDLLNLDFREIEKTLNKQNSDLSEIDRQKILTRCYQYLLVEALDRHISLKKMLACFMVLYGAAMIYILFT